MPKAAIYARVSTGEQDPDNQLTTLRTYAEQQQYTVHEEYVDIETGRTARRSAFQRLLHDARRRRFDVLLFFSFSRLSREGPARTAFYLHELEQAGVSYTSWSEREWLNTTGRWAFVVTMMMATIAQMEVDQLSARTKAGIERARRQGKRIGRPPRVMDVYRAREWEAEGLSLAEMARRAGVSERTIKRRLGSVSGAGAIQETPRTGMSQVSPGTPRHESSPGASDAR